MSSNLINQEDPEDWIQSQKLTQFESFVEDEVVGSHCSDCQFTPDPIVKIGSLEAELMVVGEFPTERDQGNEQPFSGELGALLERMVQAINRDLREDCYLTNAVLCGGDNQEVHQRSVQACSVNLHRQLELVSPTVVLIMGRLGYCSLYNESVQDELSDVLGYQGGIPDFPWVDGVVTMNPVHLIRCTNGSEQKQKLKSLLWDHLCTVENRLEENSGADDQSETLTESNDD